jgi:hypothetical protein
VTATATIVKIMMNPARSRAGRPSPRPMPWLPEL